MHVATSLGEYQTADGHAEASIAALVGGTTTMVDFAIPDDGLSPLEAADERIRLSASARCPVVLHGCVTQAFTGDVAAQLAGMVERGIRSVKVFTTYRDAFMATRRPDLPGVCPGCVTRGASPTCMRSGIRWCSACRLSTRQATAPLLLSIM